MEKRKPICYLCGGNIEGVVSDDHVPPRQFYAKGIRQNHSPNLLTLPVHHKCNTVFQKDEDYFVMSVAPLAMESYSGRAIAFDIHTRAQRPEGFRLGQMILSEFDMTPGGIVLPSGVVVKRFDNGRITRVIWKIVRGLFYHEYQNVLPSNTPRHIRMLSVGEKPPEEFAYVRDTESRGQYPGVFDYKVTTIPQMNSAHYWALLLWDKIIVIVAFHDPACSCGKCETARANRSPK